MRLGLITLSLALLLLLMHLLLFRFLPGSEVIDLPFLRNLNLPDLFVGAPPPAPPTSVSSSGAHPTTTPGGPAAGTFRGPTGQPHVNGPTAPPPNY